MRMASIVFPNQENRPVKKPRLGPPEVYPQDIKQKEDELNAQNVKHGFQLGSVVSDECGSARDIDITLEKCSTFYNNLFKKKTENSTLQDSKNKKFQVPKDNFWPAACSQVSTDAWFRDLAGNKPLATLSKKVPTFNKKEDIFSTLCKNNVPNVRAAWFIKMTAAHNMGTQDSRNRRKQTVDQSMDWTQALTKYLKDQLQKVQDYHYAINNAQATTFLLAQSPTPSQVDLEAAMKNWNYCTRFANHMYEEGLFDRHEFLSWLIELPDKIKQIDDVVLKLILTQLNTYSSDICKSVILARRLASFCGKKMSNLISEMDHMLGRTDPMVSTNGTPLTPAQAIHTTMQMSSSCNPLFSAMAEFKECHSHRYIVLQLCALAQIITIKCPTSMVWNCLGDGKSNSYLAGSPLDMFPCATSNLPMPPGSNNGYIRTQLKLAEQQIIARGHAAEVHWSSDKCQQSAVGYIMSKVLEVLDILDQHNFDTVDLSYNMDSLYTKIFSLTQRKETGDPPIGDEPIINLLVDWAVSTQRVGDHRCIVVALLLERRQNEIRAEKYGDIETTEDKEGAIPDNGAPPVFQGLLMNFLDTKAPVLEDHANEDTQQAFKNLILLMNELIVHDVFSHDAYMHMLISRGDLGQAPAYTTPTSDNEDLFSVKSQSEISIKPAEVSLVDDDINVDMDLHTAENNLQSFFPSMKDESKPSPEQPASVKSIKSEKDQHLSSVADFSVTPVNPPVLKGPSRHMIYATHFPIPQDVDDNFSMDDCSSHEINQRMIVLYGVGKARDEARHLFKKISKEIVRLFSKRNCIDVTSGDLGKVKKKKEKDTKEGEPLSVTPSTSNPTTNLTTPNFDNLQQKFAKLSYFDQHQVTSQCTAAVLDQIKSFTAGNFTYLPLGDNISFLFDLMQQALNISGLLDFIIRLLKDLVEVEKELHQKDSFLTKTYTTEVCLNIVAVLRRYHSYLLSPQGLSSELFIGLTDILKVVNVCNPINCSTAERCVLTYLYDIYTTCTPLQLRHSEIFNPAYSKMKATLFAQITPSSTNAKWDQNEMKDIIKNAKLPDDAARVHKALCECPTTRYSFVCNAMLEVINTSPDNLRSMNDLAVLCAELTAHCNSLSQEWLGVLKALCLSSQGDLGFLDVLTIIDVGDLSLHDSLAVFTAMLIARHCFALQDFVFHVALPSLMAVCGPDGDAEAESGARLSCHLLLRLFKPSYLIACQSGLSGVKNLPLIRNSCDRHLLEAAHLFIKVGPMLAVLKAMLKLADESNEGSSNNANSNNSRDNNRGGYIADFLRNLDNENDFAAMMSASSGAQNGNQNLNNGSLSEFAKRALSEICRQDWVREKFLRNPSKLFTDAQLNDPILSYRQAQQLLQMICYPTGVPNQMEGCEPENKHVVERVLQTLDQWTQRVSWLELQLLFERSQNQQETNVLLDLVSRGTIDLFHQLSENQEKSDAPISINSEHKRNTRKTIWLVAPLIAKLPNSIQGRVLKLAAQVLESGNNLFVSAKSKQEKEKNMKSKSLLGHQPFLSLVLSCLKGQDEQREFLLRSLMSQMEMFISNAKDMMDKYPDDTKLRQHLQEALQLRLSLVGGMFDIIQRNNTMTSDWALILVQLVSHDVVDCQVNSELFVTIVDMLTVLIHGTLLCSEGQEKGDDNKKPYFNLIKKLRRELGDKNNSTVDQIRQLLPLPKQPIEVITVEPYGAILDNKGNRVPGLDGTGKKPGMQVAQKYPFNAWEIIEGHKNNPPIPWSFFGAVRMEKKSLKYEDQKRIDLYHTHSLRKPLSYYLEPPNLPPEDLEPEKEKIDEKPKEPEVLVDANKKAPSKRKKARTKTPSATSSYMSPTTAMNRPFYPQDAPMMSGPPQMWPPYGPGSQPYPSYSNQTRTPMNMQHSKASLYNMIRNKQQMTTQFNPQPQIAPNPRMPGMQKPNQVPHTAVLRHHIMTRRMESSQGVMGYPGSMPAQNQSAMGHPMGQQQGYNYNSMQPNRMMDHMGQGSMMAGGYNQSYTGGPQTANMMGGPMPPQTNFMPSAGGQATPQFSNNPQRMSAGMGGMQSAGNTTMNSYSQGPMNTSGGPQGQQQSSYMANPMANSHQMQLRQQMMAMQQQQQPQPGMTPMQAPQQRNVMAMRRMSSSMQGPPQAPAPQYGYNTQY